MTAGSLVHAVGSAAATISSPAVRGPWNRPQAVCDLTVVKALSAAHPDVNQFIVMATNSFEATTGSAWVASRRDSAWTCDTSNAVARFGRAGTRPLLQRRSGDGTTPAGVFPLGVQTAWDGQTFSLFGNRSQPGHLRASYRKVRPQDCWGATPGSPSYGHLVNKPSCPGPDDEWLPRFGDVYAYAAVIGANMPPAGEVSGDSPDEPAYAAAIFMHHNSYTTTGASKPTSGCVSLPMDDLITALQLIDPALNPHFAIGPTEWLTTAT